MLESLTAVRGRFIAELYAGRLAMSSKVLDLGCGSGVVADILRQQFGLDLTCADTARRLKRDLPFVVIPAASDPPFGVRAFDVTMLNDVLHHVTDQKDLIDRALRVAGRVFIFEVEPGWLLRLFDLFINLLHYGGLPAPGTYRTPQDWREFLSENGYRFELTEVGRPAFWYPFKHMVIVIEHA
jgi:SAM-dependent methyltransferase